MNRCGVLCHVAPNWLEGAAQIGADQYGMWRAERRGWRPPMRAHSLFFFATLSLVWAGCSAPPTDASSMPPGGRAADAGPAPCGYDGGASDDARNAIVACPPSGT